MTYLADPKLLLVFTLAVPACTGDLQPIASDTEVASSTGDAPTSSGTTGSDTTTTETETSDGTTNVMVTGESSSGGPESDCSDEGCFQVCPTDHCELTDALKAGCDQPSICPNLIAGDELVPAEFIDAAHCLLQALRDGTVGKIRFSTSHYSKDMDFDASAGTIHVLPGRRVLIDVTTQSGGGLSPGHYKPMCSKVLDIVGSGSSSWAPCIASQSLEELMTCTGIGASTSTPNTPIDLPWLTGTCAESTDVCS